MIGIVISIVVSGIIAFVIAKWQMKKNKIEHFTINSYDIGKGLSDDFPGFNLQFDGESLSKNVRVLKGGFMNTGKNDIDKPVFTIDLPKDCVVKTIKVTPSTGDLDVKATINQEKTNTIQFVIDGIFISDEYFEYTAIVEVSRNMGDLEEELSFQHRIKNTEKIKNIYIGQYKRVAKKRKKLRIRMLIYSIVFIPFVVYLCMYPKVQFKIFHKGTNKEVELHFDTQSNLIVCKPNSILFPFNQKISREEFENNYRIDTTKSYKLTDDSIILIVESSLFLILLLAMFLIEYVNKDGHIIKVLNKKK